jgi:hypothetical protein
VAVPTQATFLRGCFGSDEAPEPGRYGRICLVTPPFSTAHDLDAATGNPGTSPSQVRS